MDSKRGAFVHTLEEKQKGVVYDTYLPLPHQLRTYRRYCLAHDSLFQLFIARLQLAADIAIHYPDARFHAFRYGGYTIDYDRRLPSPIADSIFLRVADAIAFAFSAPRSRCTSSSEEWRSSP